MSTLKNKIDFVALVSVTQANSNGDPLNGNRPRTNLDGFGEISDVCIKRKIRNRMQDMDAIAVHPWTGSTPCSPSPIACWGMTVPVLWKVWGWTAMWGFSTGIAPGGSRWLWI